MDEDLRLLEIISSEEAANNKEDWKKEASRFGLMDL